MRYLTKLSLFFICYLMLSRSVQAQTKALTEVSVDLASSTFTGTNGLPFDVPFKIKGTVPGTVNKIVFQYRVKPSEFKSWMQTDDVNWSKEITWSNYGDPTKDQPFYLTCGMLYPNVIYDFKFQVYRAPNLNPTQVTALNQALFNIIDKFITNNAAGGIANLESQLNATLAKAAGPSQLIKNTDGTNFSLTLTGPDLNASTNILLAVAAKLDAAKTNINGSISQYQIGQVKNLRAHIASLTGNGLNPGSKATWDGPVAPAVTDYKATKFSDIASLVGNTGLDITEIFSGKKKINGNTLDAMTAYNQPSVDVLVAFYTTLQQLKQTDNSSVFSNAEIRLCQDIIVQLNNVTKQQTSITEAQKQKADVLANFPDLLSNKFLYLTYILSDQPSMDVVSESNPYVGLDYGTAFAFNYGQLFLYEGVNFYFAPVNKDAPLSTIHGLVRNLAKRVSIHIGITQNLIANQDKRYAPLINNVGSILAGVGVRFNRIMRVNAGALIFYQTDVNPLVDNKTVQVRPAVSLTFDLNVAKALGSLGKAIGIPQ